MLICGGCIGAGKRKTGCRLMSALAALSKLSNISTAYVSSPSRPLDHERHVLTDNLNHARDLVGDEHPRKGVVCHRGLGQQLEVHRRK